jgi:hypothetical protein
VPTSGRVLGGSLRKFFRHRFGSLWRGFSRNRCEVDAVVPPRVTRREHSEEVD